MSKATWLLEVNSDDEDGEERARADRTREEVRVVLLVFRWCLFLIRLTGTRVFLAFVSQIIDDFSDVTDPQKRFFKHWNRFMSETRSSIHQQRLPHVCIAFVQQYATTLQEEKGMEAELISHLTNMHDEGVIGGIHVLDIMNVYNELAYRAKLKSTGGS